MVVHLEDTIDGTIGGITLMPLVDMDGITAGIMAGDGIMAGTIVIMDSETDGTVAGTVITGMATTGTIIIIGITTTTVTITQTADTMEVEMAGQQHQVPKEELKVLDHRVLVLLKRIQQA